MAENKEKAVASQTPDKPVPSQAVLRQQRREEIRPEVPKVLDTLKPGADLPEIIREAVALIDPPKTDALALKEFTNTSFRMQAPASVTDLRLLHRHPTFFSSFTNKGIQKFDTILCIAADELSMCDLLVTHADDLTIYCDLINFHKVPPRPAISGDTDWLRNDDKIVWKTPSATLPGGCVIVRPNGVELMEGGLPWKRIEDARRWYLDASFNRSDTAPQYLPR